MTSPSSSASSLFTDMPPHMRRMNQEQIYSSSSPSTSSGVVGGVSGIQATQNQDVVLALQQISSLNSKLDTLTADLDDKTDVFKSIASVTDYHLISEERKKMDEVQKETCVLGASVEKVAENLEAFTTKANSIFAEQQRTISLLTADRYDYVSRREFTEKVRFIERLTPTNITHLPPLPSVDTSPTSTSTSKSSSSSSSSSFSSSSSAAHAPSSTTTTSSKTKDVHAIQDEMKQTIKRLEAADGVIMHKLGEIQQQTVNEDSKRLKRQREESNKLVDLERASMSNAMKIQSLQSLMDEKDTVLQQMQAHMDALAKEVQLLKEETASKKLKTAV